MELTTVLELVKAGFTKDEIMQMAQPQTPVTNPEPVPVAQTEPTPEPVQEPVAEPVAVAVPAATPVPTAQQEPSQPSMADIMQSIAKLTSAVQANAIAQSVIPQGLGNPVTAEDMLAEIIRPTFKERG